MFNLSRLVNQELYDNHNQCCSLFISTNFRTMNFGPETDEKEAYRIMDAALDAGKF
jgi:hypothetical protein